MSGVLTQPSRVRNVRSFIVVGAFAAPLTARHDVALATISATRSASNLRIVPDPITTAHHEGAKSTKTDNHGGHREHRGLGGAARRAPPLRGGPHATSG